MSLNNLKPAHGSKQTRKRVGRGPGSGNGKTAGRGNKGAQSRSGYSYKRGFEGGQMPLHRRVPKRGFNNIFRNEYDVVNLDQLEGAVRRGRHGDARRAARASGWFTAHGAGQGARPRRGDQGADGAGAQVQRKGRREDGRRRRQGRSDRLAELRLKPRALRSKALRNLFADRGPPQPGVVHARDAGGLSSRQSHPDAGREPGGARGAGASRRRTRCSACTTCSRAAACRGSRSSRWA